MKIFCECPVSFDDIAAKEIESLLKKSQKKFLEEK